ncbi:hypothetical protein GBA52_006357 [Prunus armeniaca]|nr:hypothetical protein GBA52_006357 [Prunus armeniaca]
MAEDMQFDQSIQSPNTVMPSTPLQLSGFLSGDTIEVKGDTGNLKFSVQFSVQKKHTPDHQNHSLLNSLDANACYPENHFSENSSFSSYMTPNAVQEVEDHQSASCTQPSKGNEIIESTETRNIVTRLRSGVISPVNYFPPISSGRSLMRPCCGGSEKSRKKNRGKLDVFERVLRRHSSPIKPCTSYSFFVMATWGVVKSSSFGETIVRGDGYEGQCKVQDAMHAVDGKATQSTAKR